MKKREYRLDLYMMGSWVAFRMFASREQAQAYAQENPDGLHYDEWRIG